MTRSDNSQRTSSRFIDAPNLSIDVGNLSVAYRDVGPRSGIPIILLNHWGAVLDNFDPRIVDGLARKHRVVAIDYRGIGASSGVAPVTTGQMAKDTIAFIHAMGFEKVHLFGFSLGGFVAQDITLKVPELVQKLVLTGTGPAGGEGIEKVGKVSWPLITKAILTFRDPKFYLFFTSTPNGRKAAKEFLARIKERKRNRDKAPTLSAFLRQLKAIKAWGKQPPQNLGSIQIPVLIVNGDNDIMVPTSNSTDMAKRIPGSQLVIYEDGGHGGIFQNHSAFVATAISFLKN